ncbi:MAG: hypothetical protein HUK20_09115 [Fibrobacter sp.]|nr:hypothetical protein [Fibrobacter sp.]
MILLLSAAEVFAIESVDCSKKSSEWGENGRCVFYRIREFGGVNMFIVDDGAEPIRQNALPNQPFYIYVPDADGDSVDAFYVVDKKPADTVHNMKKTVSDANGIRQIAIKGYYPDTNIYLGSALTESSEPIIVKVFNFYVPQIQYYVGDTLVTKDSKISLHAGDTLEVAVKAVKSFGPETGVLDQKWNDVLYFSAEGQSESLEFLSAGGQSLKKSDGSYSIEIKNGECRFLVYAPSKVVDGKNFAVNAFKDGTEKNGNSKYILKEPFPGELQFQNPDIPALDSAKIYDADGDGVGDSIHAWFDSPVDSIKEFSYSWPTTKEETVYGGDKVGLGSEYALPDVETELFKGEADGYLKAEVCNSVSGLCSKEQTKLVDQIGAVIQTATLVKGNAGKDSLVLRFNKDIDESWDKGQGLMINGSPVDVKAVKKDGDSWVFVLDTGLVEADDMVKISTDCSKSKCPTGIITAADGIPTSSNNQEVPVKNSGRVFVDNEKNGFYDRNGDGRMDSVSVGFEKALTYDDLKSMEVKFYWLDTNGMAMAIIPKISELELSEDGHVLSYSFDPEKYGVQKMLTAIDQSYADPASEEYGYAEILNRVRDAEGNESIEPIICSMNDRMPPLIQSTFLNPESFQKFQADRFTVTFTEPMDRKSLDLTDDCLIFTIDGEDRTLGLEYADWSADGRSVTFFLEFGEDLSERMNPADSVKFNNFKNGFKDSKGNKVVAESPKVMVQGDPRVITKTFSYADLNKAEELGDNAKKFYMAHVKSADDIAEDGSLGVLMDVNFATIMKTDKAKADQLNLEKMGISYELRVYTNLGNYVGGIAEDIACDNEEVFDGNCLENADKLYLRWNMRADSGRRVGVGAYLAKFVVKVYGAKEDFKMERIFRWGITATKR